MLAVVTLGMRSSNAWKNIRAEGMFDKLHHPSQQIKI